jgi:hypothetical protein
MTLLSIVKVAVISGGDWPQFEKQLLSNLPHDERLANLSLLPTCGTKFYRYDSAAWKRIYSEDLTPEERDKILNSLKKAIVDFKTDKVWGEQIEDRGSQITFSALGQQAPSARKDKWDTDFSKRKKFKAILDTLIPEFSVLIGVSPDAASIAFAALFSSFSTSSKSTNVRRTSSASAEFL